MDINNQTQDPIKKINKTKTTSQLKSFFESNGYDIQNPTVQAKINGVFDDPKTFEEKVKSLYSVYYEGEDEVDFSTVFESMYDIKEAPIQESLVTEESEKKNPLVNQGVTGSASTSAFKKPSLGLSYDKNKSYVTPSNIFSKVVKSLDKDILSEDPVETVKYLNTKLSNYGFQFEIDQTSVGTQIIATNPQGQKKPFRFYEEGSVYTDVLGEGSLEGRKEKKLNDLKEYLLGTQDRDLPFTVSLFSEITLDKFLPTVDQFMKDSFQDLRPDLEDVARKYSDVAGIDEFLTQGNVNVLKSLNALTEVKNKLSQKDYIPERVRMMGDLAISKYDRKAELATINAMITKLDNARFENSAIMGNILSESGAYKNIDYTDPLQIKVYGDIGLLPEDLPLESIIIDGKASSLNKIYDILGDFEKVDDIRDGIGHEIQINDSSLSGLLSPEVDKVRKTMDIQRARKSELADVPYIGSYLRAVENQFYRLKDMGSNLGLSAMDIMKNLGIVVNHGYKSLGYSDKEADMMTYGMIPMLNFKGFRPEYVNTLREESVPYNEGGYMEDLRKGQFFQERTIERLSDDFSSNFLHSLAFIANPALGLGLQFINDTGEKMYASDQRIKALREKEAAGKKLTIDERNTLEAPEIISDLYSISGAAKNAGLTYLFVGKYLKNLQSLGKAAKAAQTVEGARKLNIRDLYNQYAKYQSASLVRKLGMYTGLNAQVFKRELLEENLIAGSDYWFDVLMGYREWNWTEFNNLIGNVSVATVGNSAVIGAYANQASSNRAQVLGKSVMKNFLVIPNEIETITQRGLINARINELRQFSASKGIDVEQNSVYQDYKKESVRLANELSLINARKGEFVESMSKADRINYLGHIANIESAVATIEESTDLDVIDRSKKNIEVSKESIRNILQNTQSGLALHFASEKTRNEVVALAALSQKYTLQDGEELTYNSLRSNAEIMAAAEDIYRNRIREKNIRINDEIEYDVESHFGVSKKGKSVAIEEYDALTSESFFSDLDALFNDAQSKHRYNKGDFTLDEALGKSNEDFRTTLRALDSDIADLYDQLDVALIERTGIMAEVNQIEDILDSDQELSQDEINTYISRIDDLMAQADSLTEKGQKLLKEVEDKDFYEADVFGREFAFRVNDYLGKTDKSQENIDRAEAVFGRINRLGKENFYQNISTSDRASFEKFLKDYNRTGTAIYGPIESIIEAQEALNQVKANSGGKLRISSKKDGSDLVGASIDVVRNLYTINDWSAATTDVLLKFLFRDSKVGKPFIEKYQNLVNKYSVADRKAAELRDSHEAAYAKDAREEGVIDDILSNPRSRYNSYEMYMLAYLRRVVLSDPKYGPLTEEESDAESSRTRRKGDQLAKRRTGIESTIGTDFNMFNQKEDFSTESEFLRVKQLLIERGDLLRTRAFEKGATIQAKRASEIYDQVLSDLRINEANNFSEVSERASKRNLRAVERMASMYDSDAFLKRIEDFEDHQPTLYEKGTYVPMLMTVQGKSSSDFTMDKSNSISGSLEATTRPSSLMGGEIDLNMELFFENIYGRFRSTEIDIATKKDREVFNSMVNSPAFESIFEDGKEQYAQNLMNPFRKIKKGIEREIDKTDTKVYDIDQMTNLFNKQSVKQVLSSLESTITSLVSAKVLSKGAGNLLQFGSAVGATFPHLNSARAKYGMATRMIAFPFFLAKSLDGTDSGAVSSYINRLSGLEKSLSRQGRMNNIFKNSRTGSRNSVFAEAGVLQNKKLPFDYYMTDLGISRENYTDEIKEIIGRGLKYTVDEMFDVVQTLSNTSMELFLANGDKVASNTAFEFLYMDYRLHNQGAKIKGKLADWWAEENANPNKEAINYADSKVAELMKQTESFTDADIYKADASSAKKVGVRALFQFGRFIMNAKSSIASNLAIMNDPKVDPEQREMAKRNIQSRAIEIVTYNAIKFSTNAAQITGAITPMLILDDDDIERYGRYSITGIIGSDLLPIEDRGDFQVSGLSLDEAESIEQYNAIYQNAQNAMNGLKEISTIAEEYNDMIMEYENKFTVGNNYSVIKSTIQDLAVSMQPLPIPQQILELMGAKFNELYGDEVVLEFMSEDLKNLDTASQWASLVAENLGTYSLVYESANEWFRATTMREDLTMNKSMGEVGGTNILYLTAPNDKMREQLLASTEFLYQMRMNSLFIPGFKGDFDRLADRLERSIEKYFTRSHPDFKLIEMAESRRLSEGSNLISGLQEEEYEPVSVMSNGRSIQQYPVPTKQVLPQGPVNQRVQTTDEVKPKQTKPKNVDIDIDSLGFKFEKAQGNIDLPVEGAPIKEKQGLLKDPEYSGDIITMNRGVIFEAKPGDQVKSVFDGVVTSLLATNQGKMGVVINHGNYTTTYFGISDLNVQKGDTIPKGTVLGEVFEQSGGRSDLRFYVYKDQYLLNPEEWLKKAEVKESKKMRVQINENMLNQINEMNDPNQVNELFNQASRG